MPVPLCTCIDYFGYERYPNSLLKHESSDQGSDFIVVSIKSWALPISVS